MSQIAKSFCNQLVSTVFEALIFNIDGSLIGKKKEWHAFLKCQIKNQVKTNQNENVNLCHVVCSADKCEGKKLRVLVIDKLKIFRHTIAVNYQCLLKKRLNGMSIENPMTFTIHVTLELLHLF